MRKGHISAFSEEDTAPIYHRCLPWLCYILLTMLAGCSMALAAPQETQGDSRLVKLDTVREEKPAPDFSLHDRKNNLRRLSDYRGHVVVVNFWSTWCIPCRKEMPALERTWLRINTRGGVVLGVAMQDEPADIEHFLAKVPVSFSILMDRDGEVAKQWGVVGIPMTFILNPEGQIVYKASGIREWDSDLIINRIMELL